MWLHPYVGMPYSTKEEGGYAGHVQHDEAAKVSVVWDKSILFLTFLFACLFAKRINSGMSLYDSELEPPVQVNST